MAETSLKNRYQLARMRAKSNARTAEIYLLDLKAGLADQPRGPSRRKETDLMMYQALREVEESSLVIYRKDSYFSLVVLANCPVRHHD